MQPFNAICIWRVLKAQERTRCSKSEEEAGKIKAEAKTSPNSVSITPTALPVCSPESHSVWLGCELGQMTRTDQPAWASQAFQVWPTPLHGLLTTYLLSESQGGVVRASTCRTVTPRATFLSHKACVIYTTYDVRFVAQNTHNISAISHWYMDIWHSQILALNLNISYQWKT